MHSAADRMRRTYVRSRQGSDVTVTRLRYGVRMFDPDHTVRYPYVCSISAPALPTRRTSVRRTDVRRTDVRRTSVRRTSVRHTYVRLAVWGLRGTPVRSGNRNDSYSWNERMYGGGGWGEALPPGGMSNPSDGTNACSIGGWGIEQVYRPPIVEQMFDKPLFCYRM